MKEDRGRNISVEKKKGKCVWFAVVLFTMCFSASNIISFAGITLHVYEIAALGLFPFLLGNVIRVPVKTIMIYFLFLVFHAFFSSFFFGFNSLIFNYVFSFYWIIVVFNCGTDIDRNDWMKIIRVVFTVLLVILYIKLFLFRDQIVQFIQSPYGHPAISTVFGGGVNIEASWMCMFSVFFLYRGGKKDMLYWIAVFVLSVLYASRTGVLIALIILGWFLIVIKKVRLIRLITLPICFLTLIVVLQKIGLWEIILVRLNGIGTDGGSMGRLRLWGGSIEVVKEHLWGVGCGKAVDMIRGLGYFVPENNVHNIFLQTLVDQGVIGALFFCLLWGRLVAVNIRNRFTDPFGFFLLVYLIQGMVQMRGMESLMAYILGIFLLLQYKRDDSGKPVAIRDEMYEA